MTCMSFISKFVLLRLAEKHIWGEICCMWKVDYSTSLKIGVYAVKYAHLLYFTVSTLSANRRWLFKKLICFVIVSLWTCSPWFYFIYLSRGCWCVDMRTNTDQDWQTGLEDHCISEDSYLDKFCLKGPWNVVFAENLKKN